MRHKKPLYCPLLFLILYYRNSVSNIFMETLGFKV
jgi:hypothetical protein